MNEKGNLYQTTALVTFCSVAERALGFLYRIVLARLLGAEGLGLYQIALSHFALFRTLGGGGLPVSTSRLVAKQSASDLDNSGGVLSAASVLSLLITIPLGLVFCLLPFPTSSLKILLFALPFTCLYAVVKGFFWGKNQFLFPALLEMAEEILTVLAGVLLLRFFGQNCTALSSANLAIFACVIGCVLSFVFSLLLLFTFPKQTRKLSFQKPLFKEVGLSALPVTGMRVLSTLLSSAVAAILPVMLIKTGLTQAQATAEFGVATGMAFPLLSMPLTIVGSFALVLTPKLSQDFYKGNTEKLYQNVEKGLTASLLVAFALLPFFFVLGEKIGLLTYENALAGKMLKFCCPLLLPMSFYLISTSSLNSIGFEKQTFFSFLIGGACLLLCVLLLPRFFGVYAYAIGLFSLYSVCGAINACYLFKHRKPSAKLLKKCLLALLFCLPTLLLGNQFALLFSRFLGVWGTLGLTTICMVAVTLLLYWGFGLFSPPFLRKFLTKG